MLRRNLRLKTLLLVGIAVLVIAAGTLVGAVRLLDRAVPGYRAEVAEWVSGHLDQPLEIGAMDLAWTWTGPVLRLGDVGLLRQEEDETVLHLRELRLHFGFWDLLRGIRRPDGLALAGVELTLHRDEQRDWRLLGLSGAGDSDPMDAGDLGGWLDQVDRVRVEDGRLRVTDAAHPEMALNVTDIAGTLRNNSPRHRARIQAQLPAGVAGHVELDIFILGDFDRIDELQGHTYLRIEEIAGADLLQAAGIGGEHLYGGEGELEIWSDWRRGRFSGARASLSLDPLHLVRDGESPTPLLPATSVDASAEPGEGAQVYRLTLDALRTARGGALPTIGGATFRVREGSAEGRLRDLPAALAADWLKLAAPGQLSTAGASGTLDELRWRYGGDGDWSLDGAFSSVAIRHADTGLESGRFDGRWSLGGDGGELEITAGSGEVAVDRYLQDRLPLQAAHGRITWRDTADGWHVAAHDLHLAAAGTAITGGGDLDLPADGPPVADLAFEWSSQDLPALFTHVPQAADLPNPRLRDWLPDAIRSGRVTSGQVRIAGPLDRFPMTGDAGEFRVTAEAEDVTLAYKPGWPELSAAAGGMTLAGDDLDVRVRSGRMLGVTVGPAQAHIADVREPVLKVDGEVRGGDAQRMLGFLAQSPLAEKFGRLPETLTLTGKADLAIDLSIPLKDELGEPAITGRVEVAGLRAEHAALPEPLTGLTGHLRFDLGGVYTDDLAGELAGLPFTASLAPAADDALAIQAQAALRLPEHQAALDAFGVPGWLIDSGEGAADWEVALEAGASGGMSDLTLSSDLAGMVLALPEPAGKEAQARTPTRVTVTGDRDRLRVDYGDRVRLDLRFDEDGLWSGDAIFGDAEVTPPEGRGWWLGGNPAVLDVTAWRRLLASGDGAPGGVPDLRGAELSIGELRVAGQRLRDLDLHLVPLVGDDGWFARLGGKAGHGTARWLLRPDRDRIEVRLERLRMQPLPPAPEPRDIGGEPIEPATLPLLDIDVGALVVAGTDFGRLDLVTGARPDGLAVEHLNVTDGVMDLRADGAWWRTDGQTEANLNGRLRGSGIATLLEMLGYTANISADDADIETELRIAPNPRGLTPDTLNGRLALSLENGRLAAVEPGAGRVLGLVNFYALPRRLLLDFRDVLGKGTAFDSLEGTFRIDSGNAYTDNLTIDTPSADIQISGRVGLAARDYDQRVTITPQVSGAAAIAGTVLGGPAVGAAVWVAQQFLGKPISELTRVSYRLTGSWDNPEIEEPAASE